MCALVVILAGCLRNSPTVPAVEYPRKIVGGWIGTVGNEHESMVITAMARLSVIFKHVRRSSLADKTSYPGYLWS